MHVGSLPAYPPVTSRWPVVLAIALLTVLLLGVALLALAGGDGTVPLLTQVPDNGTLPFRWT